MRKVELNEIASLAQQAKGKINKIYLHWSAGKYNQTFADYHINVSGAGAISVSTDDFAQVLAHTWRRNTGAIGITLCCAYNAEPDSLGLPTGDFPPTKEQIEVMAKVVAVLAENLDLNISENVVMTHAEAALLDGYGVNSRDPETRWDLWKLEDFDGVVKNGGNVLRGKAIWYQEQAKKSGLKSFFDLFK